MELRIWNQGFPSNKPIEFRAEHPMFRYEVSEVSEDVKESLRTASSVVVIGIGGSSLPLEVFLDAFDLRKKVLILDTVDPRAWARVRELRDPLFCAVSKSGETLEIRALIAEVLALGKKDRLLVVTDPQKGGLRQWVQSEGLRSIELPSAIGGRFTHFTPFHRALMEALGIDFNAMLQTAREKVAALKADPKILELLYAQLFCSGKSNLILWAYGERFEGLARWAQQAIAESLGKIRQDQQRIGVMPIVLKGPQDQHSVLQLLRDGPQRNIFWFFTSSFAGAKPERNLEPPYDLFNQMGLERVQNILSTSTIRSFEERLSDESLCQPMSHFTFDERPEDLVSAVVMIQALIEYAGKRLEINAFDQPAVERGKEIARELIRASGV